MISRRARQCSLPLRPTKISGGSRGEKRKVKMQNAKCKTGKSFSAILTFVVCILRFCPPPSLLPTANLSFMHPTTLVEDGSDEPRYLVPFHPKRMPHHFTDVLIIGGGLAGLRAALAVDPRLSRAGRSPRTACCSRTAATPKAASPACWIRRTASRTTWRDTLAAGGRLVRRRSRRASSCARRP